MRTMQAPTPACVARVLRPAVRFSQLRSVQSALPCKRASAPAASFHLHRRSHQRREPHPLSASSLSLHSSRSPLSALHSFPQRAYVTQVVAATVVVGLGWLLRRKWLEIRSMRPDLQSGPRDPGALPVRFHEGGFLDKMDRREAALILGVRENASKERIMERYRQLMKVNHPDLGGSPYVSTKINEAKELLSKTARSEEQEKKRAR